MSLITAISAFVATPGVGQSAICGEREILVEHLNLTYDETQTAIGISADGQIVEVISGPSGSWTILVTNRDGLTCVVTGGDYWEHVGRPHGDRMAQHDADDSVPDGREGGLFKALRGV